LSLLPRPNQLFIPLEVQQLLPRPRTGFTAASHVSRHADGYG
jgi:hypothetical protein